MKKILMMLVVAAGCAVMTSCTSDAEKAAQLTVEVAKLTAEGKTDEATKKAEELKAIMEANKDNKDFEKEYADACEKLAKESQEAENK